MRKVGVFLLGLIWAGTCLAAPDQSMSIVPVAESGETIAASDENARNNEISTKFNSHTHADVDTFTTNTFTIGDNAVGNKTYAVNTDQAADPGIRYNTSIDFWTLSNDGSTYRTVAHTDDSNGFTSGAMLYGGSTSGAILSAGNASNGQILIGQTNGAPVRGVITGSGGAVVTNGPGTIDINAAALGTPGLTLGTANSAGVATTAVRTDATVAAFDATLPANVGTAATGSAGVAARRDHVHGSSAAWQWVETLTTTSGTSVTSSTLPTDSDLFMVVFENVRATANGQFYFQPNGTSTTTYQYTYVEGATWTTVTGASFMKLGDFGDATGAPINGVLYCPRLVENNIICIDANVTYSSDDGAQTVGKTIMGKHAGMADVTTLVFTEDSTAFTAGKIHIYKSIPS